MMSIINKASFTKFLVFLSATSATMTLASCQPVQLNERNAISRRIIHEIKSSSDLDVQADRSRDLFYHVKGQECNDIDKGTIDELTSLLRIRHDGVRYWAARSLGQMDPCARSAAHELKLIVPEADCWPGGLTSAPEIRATLTKFGEPPIRETICTGYGQGYSS
jgi:hypothetical protein